MNLPKMPKKLFHIERHTTADKEFRILCPGDDLGLTVDYDDVNHPAVDRAARKLVKILNEHWVGNEQ